MTNYIISFIAAAIRMAIPLAYAALGEMVCERAGILNIGIEGSMLCGAFFGYLAAWNSGSLLIGFMVGIFAAVILNMIHAYLSITLYQDQTICGVALNILALGVITFVFALSASSSGTASVETLPPVPIPALSQIPIIGELFFSNDVIVYLMYFIVLGLMIFFTRTYWGMELDAIGENPQAADTLGVQVVRKKYLAEVFCGAMCGIGGAYLTLVQVGRYTNNISGGRGYISLAIVVFGRRNPLGILLASVFFGAANALQYRLQNIGMPISSQFFNGLPYLLTILALLITSRRDSTPEGLAKPYIRSKR